MKRKHYSMEQIVAAFQHHEIDTTVSDIYRKLDITEHTFYRWKEDYSGLEVNQVREVK